MPDSKIVKDLIESTSLNGESKTTADDILFYLMIAVLDQPLLKLEKFLPKCIEDFINGDYHFHAYTKGFNRFV